MVGDYDGDSLFDEKLDLLLRSVRVGTIADLETRDCRLRVLLIDGTSRMVDDRRLLQGLPEVGKGQSTKEDPCRRGDRKEER